ncbi:pyruvate orthophosphate dikinase [Actinidia rufa]|uniref:Pyruvate orthophosphate dikinase n=1 Tax=Actinidia rufa TaxID=165716 RepID=A0A7J0GDV1_9ERIC|nr:pyruvate orthophosphate dikinase [Actinidia rufa]
MYGGSGKLGRGGGGRGGAGKRNNLPSALHHQPPLHRPSSGAPSGRLSVGGNRNAASAPTASAPSAAEETFSLVTGNPLDFAMVIRLAPDLVDEIKRVEAQGGTARIKFDSSANNPSGNKAALDLLLPFQRSDFEGIFCAMDGTVLFYQLKLGISFPELTEMQVRAIFEAAVSMSNKGVNVLPEIMVPLVGTPQARFLIFFDLSHQGTMIEVPRAALVADEIAKEAEFFSFGTNDLTQMTFGYSRDDAGKFLPTYISKGILQRDPFEVLDQKGVGQLVKIATEKGRGARPSLKVGICGEHGGEPSSIAFFAELGLDYVSCSPFRVPIARLAAAQVAV